MLYAAYKVYIIKDGKLLIELMISTFQPGHLSCTFFLDNTDILQYTGPMQKQVYSYFICTLLCVITVIKVRNLQLTHNTVL